MAATNPEKAIAEAVLAGSGLGAKALGLRFDRVVVRVLGDLRNSTEGAAPEGVTVLVTITAPIIEPAKSVAAIQAWIAAMLTARALRDEAGVVHGNAVRVRMVGRPPSERPRLIGFVHNPDSDPDQLLELAERWLRA